MKLDELKAVRKTDNIHLTTRGRRTGRSHTVELWFAVAPGGIYLSHEGSMTDWMKNIQRHPKVSAKVGNLMFEATAKVVGPGPAREEGKKALHEKYYGSADKDVIDDWFSLLQVIQLTPS